MINIWDMEDLYVIEIDDVFSVKRYANGWELHETRSREDGGVTVKVTYHGSLRLVAGAVVEKSCGHCADATALMMCVMATGERVATLLSEDPTT
jgi:hypothetical protein